MSIELILRIMSSWSSCARMADCPRDDDSPFAVSEIKHRLDEFVISERRNGADCPRDDDCLFAFYFRNTMPTGRVSCHITCMNASRWTRRVTCTTEDAVQALRSTSDQWSESCQSSGTVPLTKASVVSHVWVHQDECDMSHVWMLQDNSFMSFFFVVLCFVSLLRVSCHMYECANMNASCDMWCSVMSHVCIHQDERDVSYGFVVSCHMSLLVVVASCHTSLLRVACAKMKVSY